MKIASIEFIALSATLPEGKAYGMSKSLATGRATTLVRLVLDDGTEGFGEAWGPPLFNKGYLPFLSDYLVGVNVLDVEHTFDQILARHYHFGFQNPMMGCISGIDMASKDAAGKKLGVPVGQLIGGRNLDNVPIYASGGYLTENPRDDYQAQIDVMANAGYSHVKIKIGLNPASDEERLGIARGILGDDVEILVDINANYTFDLARESMARMAPYNPGWVEEPLSPCDTQGLTKLHAQTSLPIATGEALYGVHDFKPIIEARSADVLQPDLSLCGGFWQGRKIAELAHAQHLRISPHVWGGAVGLAAALQYISALSVYPHAMNVPKPVLLEYDLGDNPLRSELLKEPLVPVDGTIRVPDAPGLGIEIDMDAVERYASN